MIAQSGTTGLEDAPARRVAWQVWFGLAVLAYASVTLATQGPWLASGAMWAEMATNYYPNAHAPGWYARLLSTDAGYWPLPQRLVALIEGLIGFPARTIPFYYGATAILLGGMLSACFCHRAFRVLVQDDRVRFVVCLTFGFIPDFEARTFINVTYVGMAACIPLVALPLARRDAVMPGWAWLLPLFMLSKPVFLSLGPAMLLAAVVVPGRPRRVMLVSLVAGAAQLIRLSLSLAGGDNQENFVDPAATILQRLETAVVSGAGMLANFMAGPSIGSLLSELSPWLAVALGALLTGGLLVLLLQRHREPPAALILVGLSVVYAVGLLNSFALSNVWTLRLDQIRSFTTTRWSLAAILAAIFVAVATVQLLLNGKPRRMPLLAVAWLAASGWPLMALRALPGPFPTVGSSYWTVLADRIDQDDGPLCIPADPYQSHRKLFQYRRRCVQLNNGPDLRGPVGALQPDQSLPVPAVAARRTVIGLIVVVRPGTPAATPDAAAPPAAVSAAIEAVGTTTAGERIAYSGHRLLGPEGGLVMLLPSSGAASDLASITLHAAPELRVVMDQDGRPGIIYLAEES